MDASALPPLGILVAIVAVIILWQIVRHPVQRRLAARDASRRPGETVLVIIGSLLGTALITGSFIVGDTLDSSYRVGAHTQLGPVDEAITIGDARRTDDVYLRVASIDDERIDGVLSMVTTPASVASNASGKLRAEPSAQILELDFSTARDFGGDPEATGIRGDAPGPGETVITADLAEVLDVSEGDGVTAHLYGRKISLDVARVVPQQGLAGFWLGFEQSSPNAFVAPGTIGEVAGGKLPLGTIPPSGHVLVSNRGGVEDGAALSDEVTAVIEKALGPESALRVEKAKQDRLETAEEQGKQFSQLFLNIGMFAIIAGILLLVNIFVMLAEERKSQLGMLRAVGMRRADLVRVFLIEGALYSAVAAVVGAILGIGVGWAIVKVAAPIFGAFGDFSIKLSFTAEPVSVAAGFCIGLLISLGTILVTSIRISRINIIRAIRDLQEPRATTTRLRTMIGGTAVAVLGAVWFFPSLGDRGAWLGAILGPVMMAFGLIPLVARLIGRRHAVLVSSAFGIVWGVAGNTITGGQFFDAGELGAFVFQGVLLTFSAVVLVSQLQETFEGAIRRVAAKYLALRLGLAYPLARRFRTGLTLGMYSLVIFTMTFIAVLFTAFTSQVENVAKQEGGRFDVIVTASQTNPPSVEQIRRVDGVGEVAVMTHGAALFRAEGVPEPQGWPATGIEESFVAGSVPKLDERMPALDDDKAAWQELIANPETAIIDSFFLQGGGGPPAAVVELGEELTVIDPLTGASTRRTVIGVTSQDNTFSGVFMSRESLARAIGPLATTSRFFLQTDGTVEPLAVAENLQGRYIAHGVEADTFLAVTEETASLNLQFLRLMQGYLALGLIVGIAGLGVVMVRAVRDRRREIGVLRSLGFVPNRVRRAFLLESGFVALQGILIGAVLALVTAYQLVMNGEFGEGMVFMIPWMQVGVLCVIAFGASLLAAAWPAQQASLIPPAVALRVAD